MRIRDFIKAAFEVHSVYLTVQTERCRGGAAVVVTELAADEMSWARAPTSSWGSKNSAVKGASQRGIRVRSANRRLPAFTVFSSPVSRGSN